MTRPTEQRRQIAKRMGRESRRNNYAEQIAAQLAVAALAWHQARNAFALDRSRWGVRKDGSTTCP